MNDPKKIHDIVASVNFPMEEIAGEFMVGVRGYLRRDDDDVSLFRRGEAAARAACEDILLETRRRVLVVFGEDLSDTPDTIGNVQELIRIRRKNGDVNPYNIEEFDSDAEKKAFLRGLRYDSVTYDNFLVLSTEEDIEAALSQGDKTECR